MAFVIKKTEDECYFKGFNNEDEAEWTEELEEAKTYGDEDDAQDDVQDLGVEVEVVDEDDEFDARETSDS